MDAMTTDTDIPQGDQVLRIEAAAELEWSEIEAAEGKEKIPSFKMTAYRGGPMNVGGFFRPVVVDLAGMKTGNKQLPIFRGHDPDRIIGHGEADIGATEIKASGLISADNDHSRDVVASSRRGFPWQASIGATVHEFESIKTGDKATVNGKTVKGPVLIARKTTLSEISFVPIGADRGTSAKVAAHQNDQPPAKPPGIKLTAAGNRTGVWIEGGGTRFVSAAELETLLNQLRTR